MRRPTRALVVLAVAAAVGGPARPAPAQTVTVAVDGVPRDVPVLERQGRRFVALERVAELLGGRVVEAGPERGRLVVDDAELVVLRRLPYVRFQGRWFQMSETAQKDPTGFYLPATTLHHLLPALWPGRFPAPAAAPTGGDERSSEPPAERPRPDEVDRGMIGRGGTDLERIDVWAGPGRTRLGFRLARAPGVEVDATLPGALQLRLSGVAIPPETARGLARVGLVDSAAVAVAADGTSLTLWLARAATLYAVAPLRRPAGFEIVLIAAPADVAEARLAADLGRRGRSVARRDPAPEPARDPAPEVVREPVPIDVRTPPGAGPDVAPAEPPASEPRTAPPRGPEGGWKVVVDAGHGGHDPGASGPGGTREKTVTLAIARALAGRLEAAGIDVVLTRSDDRFVALGERTRIANRERADLFVSIHANSAENRSAEGFETYFLSAAKTEDARRVARMENAAIRYENPAVDPESLDELNFILWDLAQNEYLRESSTLAETVQEGLERRVSTKSRGVKQAPFYVLNGAFMPAILFETAFISNPREEALLNDPAFRSRVVDGLADSILAYLDRYRRKAVVPAVAR